MTIVTSFSLSLSPLSLSNLPLSFSLTHIQSTTTLDGKCTDEFTGTSASAPLLSGVIALVLQAK